MIITGILTPFNASAISCTANGFTVVLAPIHNTFAPSFNAISACFVLATSTAKGRFARLHASFNQGNPFSPIPSKESGLVLGFQIPARIN